MSKDTPARFDITVRPAYFKMIFQEKETHYSFMAPPADANLRTSVENSKQNIANILNGIKKGDSIVFSYDPSELDNPHYMGDAFGVSEIEKIVKEVKVTPGPLNRSMVAVYF